MRTTSPLTIELTRITSPDRTTGGGGWVTSTTSASTGTGGVGAKMTWPGAGPLRAGSGDGRGAVVDGGFGGAVGIGGKLGGGVEVGGRVAANGCGRWA